MYTNLFNKLFQDFLTKNPFIMVNSRIKNYTINSYDFANISNILPNEKILLNNMLLIDSNLFNEKRNELENKKIQNNLTSIYCLIFNECVNINNEAQQKKLICSSLKKYLSNILDEINQQILSNLEDKYSNNINFSKSQNFKKNKKDLKITIELLFLIPVYMINKYNNIIDNTNSNQIIKGINIKNLETTKIKEELYLILILQQNLYWIEILIDCLLTIFQNLKNNKFRLLVNADNEFNNLDEQFNSSCFSCFIPLFNVIKKYSEIKVSSNKENSSIIEYLFNSKTKENVFNNNVFLPLKISEIDKIMFKLFECFIYEFLYNMDSLWKYFDDFNNSSIFDKSFKNGQMLYGFGIYLCDFVKSIAFIRNDNLTKIDFFNFYIFSYNLVNNYFSKLNNYLYNLFTSLFDIFRNNFVFPLNNINLNYLQSLSHALKDMISYFMIFSFFNDSLKDIYSYNEILLNPLISHCFLKALIPIFSLITNGNTDNILIDIINILIDNVSKYKIILPLRCHFHKELITHNFLLILDYFLTNFEGKIVNYLKDKGKNKDSYPIIINLEYKFAKTLNCLLDHYNCINFIYSNHIIFIFKRILNNAGFRSYNYLNNIILRYIPNDKNLLYYKDIYLNLISREDNFSINTNHDKITFNFIQPINIRNDFEIIQNFFPDDGIDCVGFSLENHFDHKAIQLLSQIDLVDYEFNIINEKKYLIKNNIISENNSLNYSNILVNNGEFMEILGIDKKLNENILKIMENIQYSDKFMFKFIQDKIISNENRNIKVSHSFFNNLKYYDLKFKMNYFEYQKQIKQLLL